MERRVLLAIVLTFLVLFGYQVLFPPPPSPVESAPPAATQPPAPEPQPGTASAPAPKTPVEASPGAQPTVAAASEQDVVVENSAVRAVFTTRGGALKSWRLKHYDDSGGQPLELVPTAVPNALKPFTLAVDDETVSNTLRAGLFKPSAENVTVDSESTLTFEYQDASGLTATKRFTFFPDKPYLVRLVAEVSRNGTPVRTRILWGPALGTGVIGGGMTYNPPPQPLYAHGRDVTRLKASDLGAVKTEEGAFTFAGVDDHYFLSAAVAVPSARLEYRPIHLPADASKKGLQFIDWSIQYADAVKEATFFLGPKAFDALRAIDPELTYAIDFGMFRWMVVPLLNALKWVNGYLGNYGWSIIALTVLINLAIFPLRHKSVVSMRRMQAIQPEVKAIQDRYAKLKISDPARQKMNTELMNLYRERGVNPASGCVPMVLTLPVLFAFYAMLAVAIEIRGAPFVGWIHDLSANDPYFIWPVVMGISMLIQQRMTPAAGMDPIQQRMMMFMPIVFTAMLAWAPSGLVLYWTASNIWTIGQQAVTNKLIGPPPLHAVRPPAERRLKQAGAGKTASAKERK